MAAFNSPGKTLGVFRPTDRHTSAKETLGQRIQDDAGNVYIYGQANGAIAANQPVELSVGFQFVPIIADKEFFGVATAAFADNEYGFVQVSGLTTVEVKSDVVAGDALVRQTNASGDLLASAAGTDAVVGVAMTAFSGGTASVYLY